jgi:hypothetical protein
MQFCSISRDLKSKLYTDFKSLGKIISLKVKRKNENIPLCLLMCLVSFFATFQLMLYQTQILRFLCPFKKSVGGPYYHFIKILRLNIPQMA